MPSRPVSSRAPSPQRHASRRRTFAIFGLIAVAACGVEYRPGSAQTDTAQGETKVAGDSARPLARGPDAPAMATPTPALPPAAQATRPPEGSLEGMGDAAPAPAAAPRARTFPRTAADSSPPIDPNDVGTLRGRGPVVPVFGVRAADLRDNFSEPRGGGSRSHEALDIMAPRGTPVLSADDGHVVKLFASKAGGITAYVASPDGRYMYYYAHLDRYSDGLKEGQAIRKGDLVGFVGSTGDASPEAPHLHFAIARVADPAWWWTGTPIDPFLVLKP